MTRQQAPGPFRALGLEPRADLTDEEVHAAWRRAASATHPDREDGGDPERFAEAAAAYTVLRTRFGRGEVLADLATRPAAASAAAVTAAGPHPAAPALVTGVATWLVLTARHDLAPRDRH